MKSSKLLAAKDDSAKGISALDILATDYSGGLFSRMNVSGKKYKFDFNRFSRMKHPIDWLIMFLSLIAGSSHVTTSGAGNWFTPESGMSYVSYLMFFKNNREFILGCGMRGIPQKIKIYKKIFGELLSILTFYVINDVVGDNGGKCQWQMRPVFCRP